MRKFSVDCYVKLAPAIIVSCLFGFALMYVYTTVGWLHLLVKSSLVSIFYLLSIWLLGFNKEERQGILSKLKKMLNNREKH